MPLAGRVALVTGAGSGSGEATGRRFGAEGAVVVANAVDVDRARAVAVAMQKDGGKASAVAANVTRRDEVERMVAGVGSEHGWLDILINNAGINRDAMSHKMTEEQ